MVKKILENDDSNLVRLIEELLKININGKLAKLNATSITDNNGGRIQL